MPNVFKLIRKDAEAVHHCGGDPNACDKWCVYRDFADWHKVDEEICAAVGDKVHDIYWCRQWMDIIGFAIAVGKALGSQELRDHITKLDEEFKEVEGCVPLLPVLDYLEANYTSDAWAERGRR